MTLVSYRDSWARVGVKVRWDRDHHVVPMQYIYIFLSLKIQTLYVLHSRGLNGERDNLRSAHNDICSGIQSFSHFIWLRSLRFISEKDLLQTIHFTSLRWPRLFGSVGSSNFFLGGGVRPKSGMAKQASPSHTSHVFITWTGGATGGHPGQS